MSCLVQMCLAAMYFQVQSLLQILIHLRYQVEQPLLVAAHHIGIVNVSTIVPALQYTLAILVELVQINIR